MAQVQAIIKKFMESHMYSIGAKVPISRQIEILRMKCHSMVSV